MAKIEDLGKFYPIDDTTKKGKPAQAQQAQSAESQKTQEVEKGNTEAAKSNLNLKDQKNIDTSAKKASSLDHLPIISIMPQFPKTPKDHFPPPIIAIMSKFPDGTPPEGKPPHHHTPHEGGKIKPPIDLDRLPVISILPMPPHKEDE